MYVFTLDRNMSFQKNTNNFLIKTERDTIFIKKEKNNFITDE